MDKSPLRIGLAGLGTVGQGVIEIITRHGDMLAARSGRPIEVTAVSARTRNKNRDVSIAPYTWEDDPTVLAVRDDIDLYVELIGGENGAAKASVEAALKAGKHVVTANKALLAHHGTALAQLAEDHGVSLRFEAAVAGGIPIIKSLGEGFAANKINRVAGIMNGTTNYMLTRMEAECISYEDVFEDANKLGYLEADPSLDVGGIDAAHKLALLASLAFGSKVDFDAIKITGIEDVSLDDITQARDLGYAIKLVGIAEEDETGIEQRVATALVPIDGPLGECDGVSNMVIVEGDALGRCILEGPGAGRGATASAVMGDVMDIARGGFAPVFGQSAKTLKDAKPRQKSITAPYYVRLLLADELGTLAEVATAFSKAGLSISEVRQYDHKGHDVPVTIVTHPAAPDAITQAIAELDALKNVLARPVAFRIEKDFV